MGFIAGGAWGRGVRGRVGSGGRRVGVLVGGIGGWVGLMVGLVDGGQYADGLLRVWASVKTQ